MRRLSSGTEADTLDAPVSEDGQDMFSPGQEKKTKGAPQNSTFSAFGWMGKAASFLENVGDVVANAADQVGEYVQPISDEDDMDLNHTADTSIDDGYGAYGAAILEGGGGDATISPPRSEAAIAGVAGITDALPPDSTPLEDAGLSNETSQGMKEAKSRPPAAPLSVPHYDPRFTAPPSDPSSASETLYSATSAVPPHAHAAPLTTSEQQAWAAATAAHPLPLPVPDPVDLAEVSLSTPVASPIAGASKSKSGTPSGEISKYLYDDYPPVQTASPRETCPLPQAPQQLAASAQPRGYADPDVQEPVECSSPSDSAAVEAPTFDGADDSAVDSAEHIKCLKSALEESATEVDQLRLRVHQLEMRDQHPGTSAGGSPTHISVIELQEQNSRLQEELGLLNSMHADLQQSFAAQADKIEEQVKRETAAIASKLASEMDQHRQVVEALALCESSLKEHEELLWQSKAHGSELEYAVQRDQEEMQRVVQRNTELLKQLEHIRTDNAPAPSTSQSGNHIEAASVEVQSENEEYEKLKLAAEEHARTVDALNGQLAVLREDVAILTNEIADRDKVADTLRDGEATALRALQKVEAEKGQLQVVIQQLRATKRANREDNDAISAERDELRKKCAALQNSWERDSRQLQALQEQHSAATQDSGTMHKMLSDYQDGEKMLSQKVRELQSDLQLSEKQTYELTVLCEQLQADQAVLQQENTRVLRECENLRDALNQSEQERISAADATERKVAYSIEQHSVTLATAHEAEMEVWREKHAGLERQLLEMTQRVEDESLLRRKASLELNAEKTHMATTLENALNQLKNQSDDVVDRQLIANLIVSYFRKGCSSDVLDLISKMLSFSDEQLVAVGLKAPPRHIISDIFRGLTGQTDDDSAEVSSGAELRNGDSLAELWVNFLETEAKAAESESTQPKNGRKFATPSIGPQ